jgi:hypothetical protein
MISGSGPFAGSFVIGHSLANPVAICRGDRPSANAHQADRCPRTAIISLDPPDAAADFHIAPPIATIDANPEFIDRMPK